MCVWVNQRVAESADSTTNKTSYSGFVCIWPSNALVYKFPPSVSIQQPKLLIYFVPYWNGYVFDAFFLTWAVNFFKGMLHGCLECAHFYWTITFWLLVGGCDEITGLAPDASGNGNCDFESALCSTGSWVADECMSAATAMPECLLSVCFSLVCRKLYVQKHENVQNHTTCSLHYITWL